jgi:NADPH:quinone reductase-like Zn-dependent oxidoreductase
VLGNELAGEVIAVGRDVKRFRVADRLFARVAKDRAGAFAEQACVEEDCAAHMLRNPDFTAAAAVRLTGLTALQAPRDERSKTRSKSVLFRRRWRRGHLCNSDRQTARRPCDDNSFQAR